MSWDYRVTRDRKGGPLSVREVYYDDGKPTYCTVNAVGLSGYFSRAEIVRDLEMILADLKKKRPIFDVPKRWKH